MGLCERPPHPALNDRLFLSPQIAILSNGRLVVGPKTPAGRSPLLPENSFLFIVYRRNKPVIPVFSPVRNFDSMPGDCYAYRAIILLCDPPSRVCEKRKELSRLATGSVYSSGAQLEHSTWIPTIYKLKYQASIFLPLNESVFE
jgi:hypothetical protein